MERSTGKGVGEIIQEGGRRDQPGKKFGEISQGKELERSARKGVGEISTERSRRGDILNDDRY